MPERDLIADEEQTSSELNRLRHAIRCGQARQAESILRELAAVSGGRSELKVEAYLLAVLRFPDKDELRKVMTSLRTTPGVPESSSELDGRLLLLLGIVSNRLSDPLGALKWLRQSVQAAEATNDVNGRCDALLETARVYSWLGNHSLALDHLFQVISVPESDRLAIHSFLSLLRLGDLYREVERWALAEQALRAAERYAHEAKGGIYWWQWLDCVACTRLGLGKPNDALISIKELAKNLDELPSYLRFRCHMLEADTFMALKRTGDAGRKLDEMRVSSRDDTSSFEWICCEQLQARLDIANGDFRSAIARLGACLDWFEANELATWIIGTTVLLAECLMQCGSTARAMVELNGALRYAELRGLRVQVETIEKARLRLGVTDSAPQEEAGRVVGESVWRARQAYVLLDHLGSGGQGTVYRAYDTLRDREVALKRIAVRNSRGSPITSYDNVKREVEALAELNVPGVAKLIAYGQESENVVYVAQELIVGPNLRNVLFESRLSVVELAMIMFRLAKTLEQVHKVGLVHGDLKPENVILRQHTEPVIVDFGLSLNLARDGRPPAAGGTALYSPPYTLGVRAFARQDYYAFGVMLLDCVGARVVPRTSQGVLDIVRTEERLQTTIREMRHYAGIDSRATATLVRQLVSPFGWRTFLSRSLADAVNTIIVN